jgi:lipoate-protein ligase A
VTPPEQRPQTPSPTSSGAGPATTAPGAASTDGTLPAASPAGPLRLLTASLASDPVLDVALGSALLELIAAGEADATFRIGRPAPTLSFGRLDRILPGFPAAVATARSLGFTATLRVGGGRAAAIHEGALSFGIAQPADDGTTSDRFAWLADVVLAALARVGVRAARGRLPDEYCPGDWSINARGVKLSGLSQRVKRHATWTEGLLLVEGGERAREVLHAVHADLGLPLDPATVGAVEDLVPGIVVADVARALRDELAARGTISDAPIDPLTLARAETLRERHEVG